MPNETANQNPFAQLSPTERQEVFDALQEAKRSGKLNPAQAAKADYALGFLQPSASSTGFSADVKSVPPPPPALKSVGSGTQAATEQYLNRITPGMQNAAPMRGSHLGRNQIVPDLGPVSRPEATAFAQQVEQQYGAPLVPGSRSIVTGVTTPQFQPVPELPENALRDFAARQADPANEALAQQGLSVSPQTFPVPMGLQHADEVLRSTIANMKPEERDRLLQHPWVQANLHDPDVRSKNELNPELMAFSNPSAFLLDEAGAYGPMHAWEGGKELWKGNIMRGSNEAMEGVFETLKPVITYGRIMAPVGTYSALAGAELGSTAASEVTKRVGGGEEAQRLASNLGAFAIGALTGGRAAYRKYRAQTILKVADSFEQTGVSPAEAMRLAEDRVQKFEVTGDPKALDVSATPELGAVTPKLEANPGVLASEATRQAVSTGLAAASEPIKKREQDVTLPSVESTIETPHTEVSPDIGPRKETIPVQASPQVPEAPKTRTLDINPEEKPTDPRPETSPAVPSFALDDAPHGEWRSVKGNSGDRLIRPILNDQGDPLAFEVKDGPLVPASHAAFDKIRTRYEEAPSFTPGELTEKPISPKEPVAAFADSREALVNRLAEIYQQTGLAPERARSIAVGSAGLIAKRARTLGEDPLVHLNKLVADVRFGEGDFQTYINQRDNGLTQLSPEQLRSPEIQTRLGKTTVKDPVTGLPRPVFHWTKNLFRYFKGDISEMGIHFGTAEQAFNRGQGVSGKKAVEPFGSRTMASYVRLENPLRMIDRGSWEFDQVAERLAGIDRSQLPGATPHARDSVVLTEDEIAPVYRFKQVMEAAQEKAGRAWLKYKETADWIVSTPEEILRRDAIRDQAHAEYEASKRDVQKAEATGTQFVQNLLRAKGYDGIVYLNRFERNTFEAPSVTDKELQQYALRLSDSDYRTVMGNKMSDSYIAFSHDQTVNAFSGLDKFERQGKYELSEAEMKELAPVLFQTNAKGERILGTTTFLEDGRAIIWLHKNANESTFIHEMLHVWRHNLPVSEQEAINQHYGIQDNLWTVAHEERFARDGEAFLTQPIEHADTKVTRLFGTFREWLTNVYKGIKGSPLERELSPEVKDFYHKFFGLKENTGQMAQDGVQSSPTPPNQAEPRNEVSGQMADVDVPRKTPEQIAAAYGKVISQLKAVRTRLKRADDAKKSGKKQYALDDDVYQAGRLAEQKLEEERRDLFKQHVSNLPEEKAARILGVIENRIRKAVGVSAQLTHLLKGNETNLLIRKALRMDASGEGLDSETSLGISKLLGGEEVGPSLSKQGATSQRQRLFHMLGYAERKDASGNSVMVPRVLKFMPKGDLLEEVLRENEIARAYLKDQISTTTDARERERLENILYKNGDLKRGDRERIQNILDKHGDRLSLSEREQLQAQLQAAQPEERTNLVLVKARIKEQMRSADNPNYGVEASVDYPDLSLTNLKQILGRELHDKIGRPNQETRTWLKNLRETDPEAYRAEKARRTREFVEQEIENVKKELRSHQLDLEAFKEARNAPKDALAPVEEELLSKMRTPGNPDAIGPVAPTVDTQAFSDKGTPRERLHANLELFARKLRMGEAVNPDTVTMLKLRGIIKQESHSVASYVKDVSDWMRRDKAVAKGKATRAANTDAIFKAEYVYRVSSKTGELMKLKVVGPSPDGKSVNVEWKGKVAEVSPKDVYLTEDQARGKSKYTPLEAAPVAAAEVQKESIYSAAAKSGESLPMNPQELMDHNLLLMPDNYKFGKSTSNEPIVINQYGAVVDGHNRLNSAIRQGKEEISVTVRQDPDIAVGAPIEMPTGKTGRIMEVSGDKAKVRGDDGKVYQFPTEKLELRKKQAAAPKPEVRETSIENPPEPEDNYIPSAEDEAFATQAFAESHEAGLDAMVAKTEAARREAAIKWLTSKADEFRDGTITRKDKAALLRRLNLPADAQIGRVRQSISLLAEQTKGEQAPAPAKPSTGFSADEQSVWDSIIQVGKSIQAKNPDFPESFVMLRKIAAKESGFPERVDQMRSLEKAMKVFYAGEVKGDPFKMKNAIDAIRVQKELHQEAPKKDTFEFAPQADRHWLGTADIPMAQLHGDFEGNDPAHLQKLKQEIAKDGQKVPIEVAWHGDHFEIMDGNHRTTALYELGKPTVRADVMDVRQGVDKSVANQRQRAKELRESLTGRDLHQTEIPRLQVPRYPKLDYTPEAQKAIAKDYLSTRIKEWRGYDDLEIQAHVDDIRSPEVDRMVEILNNPAYTKLVAKTRGRITQNMDVAEALAYGLTHGDLTRGVLRNMMGDVKYDREALMHELDKSIKEWDKRPIEDTLNFIGAIEQGDFLSLQPKDGQLARQLRTLLDERRERIHGLGKGYLEHFYETYFPHMWKMPGKFTSMYNAMMARSPMAPHDYLKQRTLPLYADGIAAGLEPVTYNPARLAIIKMYEMDRFVEAHKAIDTLKEYGSIKYFKINQKAPEGWVRLQGDPLLEPKLFDKKEGALKQYGYYYAPADAARILQNFTSRGLSGKYRVYDSVRTYGNFINQVQLSLSAFHLMFTSIDAMTSQMALAVFQASHGGKELMRGNLKNAGKEFQHAIMSVAETPVASVSNMIRGHKFIAAYLDPKKYLEIQPYVEMLKQAGGAPFQDPIYRTYGTQSFRNAIKEVRAAEGFAKLPKVGKAALRTVSMGMEGASWWLMEWIVPRQKMGVFMSMAADYMERNNRMGISPAEPVVRADLGRIYDSVENRMGQLIYDNLFLNRSVKDLMMLSMRSPGWNIGTVRELGGGLWDMAGKPGEVAGLVKGRASDPRAKEKLDRFEPLSRRAAYWPALFITVGMAGAMYQKWRTGSGPDDLVDYFHPKTGNLGTDGYPERVSFASYMKDVYAATEHPVTTAIHKLHPVFSIGASIYSNRDYFGEQVYDPADSGPMKVLKSAKAAAGEVKPFAWTNFAKLEESGAGPLESTQSFFGITPSPKYIGKSKADNLAYEYYKSTLPSGPFTPEHMARQKQVHTFRSGYISGKKSADDLMTAMDEGKLQPKDLTNIMGQAEVSPLEFHTKSINDPGQALRVWKLATPEEKQRLYLVMLQKWGLADPESEVFQEYDKELSNFDYGK